jgi:hypothetical protein
MPSYVLCVSVRMRGFLFLASRANGVRPRYRLAMLSGLELGERNRADDAQVIARRGQEDRNRARSW